MDVFSKEKRSLVMAAIRSMKNASTEMRMLKAMRMAKITGWRRNSPIFGKPDFVFPAKRLAVFVDGDFWHGNPKNYRLPTSNTEFWLKKVTRNRKRDRLVSKTLRANGWTVIRFWESSLAKHPERCISKLQMALGI